MRDHASKHEAELVGRIAHDAGELSALLAPYSWDFWWPIVAVKGDAVEIVGLFDGGASDDAYLDSYAIGHVAWGKDAPRLFESMLGGVVAFACA